MSGHIAPHRWADAWAGKVGDAERAVMNAHAAKCAACSRARSRVTRASDSFATIRQQATPELSWDAVRARVHWSVSTEKHAKLKQPVRSYWKWIGAGAVAASVAVIGLVTGSVLPRQTVVAEPQPQSGTRTHPLVPTPPPPAPLVGLVNRATGDVLVDGIRPADLFGRRLAAGDVITTGDGRVDVQFGEGSAFALGTRSQLTLRKFDAVLVELVVEGTVDVTVAPRAGDQRFLVIAGDRTVEVRGTQFRVRHDKAGTAVACRHGAVAVRDGHGQVEVPASRHVDVAADHTLTNERVAPLSNDEVAQLADATPMTLPLWDPETLAHSSAPLEIATAGRREVRVDGVELGQAPMRVRVMPGRHTIEAADSNGRFVRAGWVDVAAPSSHAKPARLEVPAESPPTRNTNERRRQLLVGIEQLRPRFAACLRGLTKQGVLVGASVQISIGIDAAGNKSYLNIVDQNVGTFAEHCMREVLKDLHFSTGASATLVERINL